MILQSARHPRWPWLFPLLLSAVGCAGLPLPEAPTEDIAETRKQRAEEATQHIETSRDFAELQDAAARWSRGDAKGCAKQLRRLLSRKPEHREAQLFLADVCMAEGRKSEAIEHAQAVLDIYPANAHAKRILRKAQETRSVASADRSDEDGRDGSTAGVIAASYPSSPPDESPLETLRPHTEATDDPNDPQIPISAATEALRNNQPARALKLLKAARGHHPDSAASYRILGVAHYRMGDYESSQVALQQALSLDNSAAVTYFLLGCTQAKLGHLEAADENFRRARAIDPKYSTRQ